ncbi:MAG: group II intron maturase-specific domain-containing protein [Rhodomicrobium sp.]
MPRRLAPSKRIRHSERGHFTRIPNPPGPANTASWPEVLGRLNSMLQGWSNYFCYGTRRRQQRAVDRYVYERVRDFLVRRHKVAGRGTRRFSCETVYGSGLIRLERVPLNAPPRALR